MVQGNMETDEPESEDWRVAEPDCDQIESLISKILHKIIEDLPVFPKIIQDFNSHQILSSMPESNKNKEKVSKETEEEVRYCYQKEHLLSALQLSPVSGNFEQFHEEDSHKINKKKESVHFNSPVAIVYEFNGSSQAVSETSTQILSDSDSEDFALSQTKYIGSQVNYREHVDFETDMNKLLNMNEARKCMKEGIITAGGDCFNVQLTNTVASGHTRMGETIEKVNETDRDNISYANQTTVISDNPVCDKISSGSNEEQLYAKDKTDSCSEDFEHSQISITEESALQFKETATELNKQLNVDVEKLERCKKDIITHEKDVVLAMTSDSNDMITERSVEEKDEIVDMNNTKQTECNEKHSLLVPCNDTCTKNTELSMQDMAGQSPEFLEDKLHTHNEFKIDFGRESSFSENRVLDYETKSDTIMTKEKSEKTSQRVHEKNNTDENNTWDICNIHCCHATFLEEGKDRNTLLQKQTDLNEMENNKLADDIMQTYEIKKKSGNGNEIFTKIPLRQVDHINYSEDLVICSNQTDASKNSENCFTKLNCGIPVYQEMTPTSVKRSGTDKNQEEETQNGIVTDPKLLELHSKAARKNDIVSLNLELKGESAECNNQDIRVFGTTSAYVTEGSDKLTEIYGNTLSQGDKREQSSPEQHWSQLSKKSKQDSEEMFTTSTRKRKLLGLWLDETRNVKMMKLHSDVTVESLAENVSVPKMLKQLARNSLTDLDETVIWDASKLLNACANKKENPVEEGNIEVETQELNNGHISSQIHVKDTDFNAKNKDEQTEAADSGLEEQVQRTDLLSTSQNDEPQLPKCTDETDQDILQKNTVTQKYKTIGAESCPSENISKLEEDNGFYPSSQDIHQSPVFITATELMSQSSQDSGSTGFTINAGDLYSTQDQCRNDTSGNTDLALVSTASDAVTENDLFREQNSEQGQENGNIAEHSSKTKNVIEITEEGFKEVRLDEEVYGITLPGSVEGNIDFAYCKHTVTDQDEQIDTDQLDMYVDKAIDQLVPDEVTEISNKTLETDRANALYTKNEGQKLKLYAYDSDLCDEQGTPLCTPINKSGKVYEKCFNWKYRPSCDLDLDVPELPDEDNVIRITPLKTCGKPLRLGLSRRQPVKSSLHKLGMRK